MYAHDGNSFGYFVGEKMFYYSQHIMFRMEYAGSDYAAFDMSGNELTGNEPMDNPDSPF